MHCEARRICLPTFNYAGAFVGGSGEFVYICLIMLVHLLGEARRICSDTFDYAGAFVGICNVGPGEFVYICLIMLVHLLGYAL